MEPEVLEKTVEAILFTSDQPLTVKSIWQKLFGHDAADAQPDHVETVSSEDIAQSILSLQAFYQSRGVHLVEVAGGYRFQSSAVYASMIAKMKPEKPPKYSRALLETLAIIGYQQPITRAEIEEIRGVSVSSSVIKSLQERQWVRIVGHKDVPGKPALLATTQAFLDYFNLNSLDALPPLAEIKEMDFDVYNP